MIIKKRAYMFKIRHNGIDEKSETEEHNMLSCRYTKDLLNLQEVNSINIEHFKSHIQIYTQLLVKPYVCPCCKHETSYIRD